MGRDTKIDPKGQAVRLGIIVPSNNPDSYLASFSKSLSRLRFGLNDTDISILLCAQQPWHTGLIAHAQDEAWVNQIHFKYVFRGASMPPRMCFYRQSAAALLPEADIYMLADDNMIFGMGGDDPEIHHSLTSGECYSEVLDYMYKFPKCGLVQCHTTAPSGWGRSIRPTNNGLVTTNKGLFLRNINGGKLWPDHTLGFEASLEETVAGYWILEHGYFPARQHENPTLHSIHKIGDDDLLHNREIIMRNGGDWVRTHFRDPDWEHESGEFPWILKLRARIDSGPQVSFDAEDERFVIPYGNSGYRNDRAERNNDSAVGETAQNN